MLVIYCLVFSLLFVFVYLLFFPDESGGPLKKHNRASLVLSAAHQRSLQVATVGNEPSIAISTISLMHA